jgi:thiamine pyrophosphate-dependent acetolactate synthase large subunit-like protein
MPPVTGAAPLDRIREAAALLRKARRPVVLAGRVSRDIEAWNRRVALAERLGARVVTDLKVAAAFPTDHPLHAGAPAMIAPAPEMVDALRQADVLLSLDWLDLAGTLKHAGAAPDARIVQVSVDHHLHNGWSMDYQALPPVDVFIDCEPDVAVPPLLEALGPGEAQALAEEMPSKFAPQGDKLTVDHLAAGLRKAVGERPCALAHVSLSWNGASWPFRHPLDYLGSDGGGGVGGGPGIAVGAALALRGTGRLPVAVCGDGDFLMGVTALWTAVHYRLPLLIVVANNRSFFNDELHQERVARMRNRPVENRWVGQRISEPDIDLAAMARAQGALGLGPVKEIKDLAKTFDEAIDAVEAGSTVVVDVWVEPGYTAAMTAQMTRKGD